MKLNADNKLKKIGIIRDFDNQPKAKKKHDVYDNDKTIFVRTTVGYTLEDDIAATDVNCKTISEHFIIEEEEVVGFLKASKTENMITLCNSIQEGEIEITVPKHINEVLIKLT